MANEERSNANEPRRLKRIVKNVLDVAKVFFAGVGLVVAGFATWYAWHGKPVADAFSRVGGPTRVETAVEASRFWAAPPRLVVTVNATTGRIKVTTSGGTATSGGSFRVR